MNTSHANGYQHYNTFDDQLNSIHTLLLEISNDSKWHNLKIELKNYEIYLKREQQQHDPLNHRSNKTVLMQQEQAQQDTARPTKPPLCLKDFCTTKEEHVSNKNKTFPTKPPMRLKQSQSNSNKGLPLLQLFIRSPTMKTHSIVIWNDDLKEIEHMIHKLCDENYELRGYSKDIKSTVIKLMTNC
eukprot:152110_1